MRRDARGGVFNKVNCDGVSGAVAIAVILLVGVEVGHERQLEAISNTVGNGGTDVAGRVTHKEGHLFGSDGVGGNDQVTLVFAGLIIKNNKELALFCRGEVVSS